MAWLLFDSGWSNSVSAISSPGAHHIIVCLRQTPDFLNYFILDGKELMCLVASGFALV